MKFKSLVEKPSFRTPICLYLATEIAGVRSGEKGGQRPKHGDCGEEARRREEEEPRNWPDVVFRGQTIK